MLEVGPCEPSELIRIAEPEQLLMSDSHAEKEPQADAKPIAKLSQQIKSYKKRRRNELDILFTTRGNSDVESRIPGAYQIEADIHDRAKRIKREKDNESSPLIERMETSNRVGKQKTLECEPGKEQERLFAVSGKHGPSRWRQRIDNPLFRTPDPEGNAECSGQRESPLASAEYPRRKAQCLPRQNSEQNHTPAGSVITRAQYRDLIARSSLEPINRDRGPFDSSRSRTSSLGSRRRQSSNGTRPRRDYSERELNGVTSLDYPRSWDEATVADRRLVEMRDRKVFWNVVRDTWQDITERQIAPETLKNRHSYLVSLRNNQSKMHGSGAHNEDGADVTSENAGKSEKCPSKIPRTDDKNERIDSNEDDDDFLDDDSGQSSESEESSDSNGQYQEDSEPDGLARVIKSRSSHKIKNRIRPSASTTVEHVPASPRNTTSLSVSNQETSRNSTCGSSSWKLASRHAKSQNPLEKYYKHLKTVFKGSGLATEHAEPGTAVKALELAASIMKNVWIDPKSPESSKERLFPNNCIQSTHEEPLDQQNV